MGPKRGILKERERKKRMMCLELKKEIIRKHDRGVRVIDLAKQYERSTSTICTILKQKESIRAITPAKGVKILSKQRTSVHEYTEQLLMVWLTEKQLAGDPLTEALICGKARAIYADLLQQSPGTSTHEAPGEPFKASRGWLENFKKRTGITHSTVRHGEAPSADSRAAEDYLQTFSGVIAAGGYTPQQVFNCDETGLFWKRMPRRTYLSTEEKRMPGHKPMKDRLTLGLCANASGDCKVKPLLVYHSENPRAFKSHKIHKEELQVMWRANPKAWVTRQIFVEWVNLVFGPGVKNYLQENSLPLKALLVLDNAPAHPPNLEDDILEEFRFIKVLFLPPNTTPILQPMDQQVVSDFKKLFIKHLLRCCLEVMESTNLTLRELWKEHYNIVICLRIIDMAWQGVTKRTLTSAWRKLWPEVASEADFERLEPEASVVEEIVSLGKSMGLDMDEGDIKELMEEHSEELTTEELKELQAQQHAEDLQEPGHAQELETISTREIKDVLKMWEKLSDFIQKKHPEKVVTERAAALFDDTCITHFRNLLKQRTEQSSLGQNWTSATKRAKTNIFKPSDLQVLPSDVLKVIVGEEKQQEWSSGLHQEEDSEHPHIKEDQDQEQEEPWSSQEGGEQLQGLEEADTTKFTFTPVAVKSEDEEEEPQPHPETGLGSRIKVKSKDSEAATEDSEDWRDGTDQDRYQRETLQLLSV